MGSVSIAYWRLLGFALLAFNAAWLVYNLGTTDWAIAAVNTAGVVMSVYMIQEYSRD